MCLARVTCRTAKRSVLLAGMKEIGRAEMLELQPAKHLNVPGLEVVLLIEPDDAVQSLVAE